MPHGITQCYLPPGSGDFPALTPAEAGTRLSDPEGYKTELTWVVVVTSQRRSPISETIVRQEMMQTMRRDTYLVKKRSRVESTVPLPLISHFDRCI